MLQKLHRIITRKKIKREFREYGYEIEHFPIENSGMVSVAQWKHPFYHPLRLDQGLVDFYRRFLRPGDMAIDIGAHAGDTTIPMALAAGKEGLVLALEPNRYVFKILEVNAGLNRERTNIHPRCIAATGEDKTIQFNYSDASFCNGGYLSSRKVQDKHHKHTLDVEGRNLENLLRNEYAAFLPKLRFIKVDAEGYDKEIIRNLQPLIRAYKPVLLSECNRYLVRSEREELFDVMSDGGRSLYMAGPQEGRASDFRTVLETPLRKSDLEKQAHFDILSLPPGWDARRD